MEEKEQIALDRSLRAQEEAIRGEQDDEGDDEKTNEPRPNAAMDPTDSDTGVAPVAAADPNYRRKRQLAMNIAQFESFTSAKQRQIEKQQGPQQISTDRIEEFQPDGPEDCW